MLKGTPGTNRPEWKSETTHPDLSKKLKSKLNEVLDPELGLSIIQLGMIREVELDDQTAKIKLILTTPFCPYAPAMIEMTQSKAEEALDQEIKIELAMEPWDFSMMEEGLGSDWGLY